MLFNGRALIFTFSGTQVRIAEIERLQSLFKTSMSIAYQMPQYFILHLTMYNLYSFTVLEISLQSIPFFSKSYFIVGEMIYG